RRQPDLGRRAHRAARAKRRATGPGGARRRCPPHGRGRPRGLRSRRRWHRDAIARLVLTTPRDAIHTAVPLMILPVALCLVAALIAATHAWWALGRIWPAASEAALARAVIGDGRIRMPPPLQCAAVAGVLL